MTGYEIHVKKKFKTYRLHPDLVKLIISFLSDRQQVVFFNNSISNSSAADTAASQDSTPGPLFFAVVINDLPFHLKHSFL